jgi:hypothetical protein
MPDAATAALEDQGHKRPIVRLGKHQNTTATAVRVTVAAALQERQKLEARLGVPVRLEWRRVELPDLTWTGEYEAVLVPDVPPEWGALFVGEGA